MFFSKDKVSAGGVQYIVVGLGNPGVQYENTRHNVGFIAVDYLADKYNATRKNKYNAECFEVTINEQKCLLMKPLTYMNKSGESLRQAVNFYKVPMENVIVIYDDISLEPPNVRIRRKGTHGGHNGIRNIIECTGQDAFPRIKIGVGQKPHKDYDLADWVLSKFDSKSMKLIEELTQSIPEMVEDMIDGNIDKVMNKWNTKQ